MTDTTAPPAGTAPAAPVPDSIRAALPRSPVNVPAGPLPAGQRLVFDADSLRFNGLQTLGDLLAHVPGVHLGRGSAFGQPEPVFLAGRGAAGLEVYWDGMPHLPLGRDSVFLDPARIPLGPLERVEVLLLPGAARVYLVSRAPQATEPVTSIEIATGTAKYAVYRGTFTRRWPSGFGIGLRADFGATDGAASSPYTRFRSSDLWVRFEYAPTPHLGAEVQLLSAGWKRDAGPLGVAERDVRRSDGLVRLYARQRSDGLGARAEVALGTSSLNADAALAADTAASAASTERRVHQLTLDAAYVWRRASVSGRFGYASERIPSRLELAAAWAAPGPLTLAVAARRATYTGSRAGERAHASAGLTLPLGFSLRGDAAVARDLHAPALLADSAQETSDVAVALRWDRSFVTLEAGAGRRSAFTPVGFPDDLTPAASLGPTPETEYVTGHASLRPLPGLRVGGWYAAPVSGGGDFELPRRARYAVTFHTKFWRRFRSGAFTLHAEVAGESWSGGPGGRDSLGAPLRLTGGTFVETNLRVRILDVTLFWAVRNANLMRSGYVPGRDYPRSQQYYGAYWSFRN